CLLTTLSPVCPATSILLVLLSHCPAAPRDLPPFPTRRSSDLCRSGSVRRRAGRGRRGCRSTGRHARPRSPPQSRARRGRRHRSRSEEHTSELQSRFDLVCRLLLEKKKQKKTDNRRAVLTSGTQ